VRRWTAFLLASRETAELRAEDRHLGRALARVLADMGTAEARDWDTDRNVCWAALFALAAVRWGIDRESAAAGYLWAWLENQVAAGVKLIPLGQTAGQRVLLRVSERIPAAVEYGFGVDAAAIGASAPGAVLASAAHETQYTRLFRS
jgi:urease accessory protein